MSLCWPWSRIIQKTSFLQLWVAPSPAVGSKIVQTRIKLTQLESSSAFASWVWMPCDQLSPAAIHAFPDSVDCILKLGDGTRISLWSIGSWSSLTPETLRIQGHQPEGWHLQTQISVGHEHPVHSREIMHCWLVQFIIESGSHLWDGATHMEVGRPTSSNPVCMDHPPHRHDWRFVSMVIPSPIKLATKIHHPTICLRFVSCHYCKWTSSNFHSLTFYSYL